jgi:hypothetical protein|tara:strand:- start:282 stop:899 length:618 start_codon:yes stop_codon:yes gene_type:complete
MRVLIACEFSGLIREAFARHGHTAWSCDLLPTEQPVTNGGHYVGDVRDHLREAWDLMIAHPPCTYLAVSGARWFKDRPQEQMDALAFVRDLMDAPIDRIAVENPISVISSKIRQPDQIIQPWQFGHGEVKATCLWLKGLPRLIPTHLAVTKDKYLPFPYWPDDAPLERVARVHRAAPSPDRWKERSRTLEGIANAMAEQWGRTDE